MKPVPYELDFHSPILLWDEAIPLGNGLCGALLYGKNPLRISLDRNDLWDLRPARETLDPGYTYQELVRLVKERKQKQITPRFASFYNNTPYPSKIPAGAMEFHFTAEPQSIHYHLNLRSATADIHWKTGERETVCTAFLSRETNFGYLLFTGEGGEALSLVPPNYQKQEKEERDSLSRLGYPEAQQGAERELSWFIQHTATDLSYAILAGRRETEDGTLYVFAIPSSRDGEQWLQTAKDGVRRALETGWRPALTLHTAWWEAYHAKSAIRLPQEAAALERHWFLNNYLFASTSRKGCAPLALQGVWTADNGKLPPWKGDYHYDLNVQLSYSHYLAANRLEEGECIVDYLLDLAPSGRRFAKNFFGCDGLSIPSISDLEGGPMGGWAQYSYSPTNHLWSCCLLSSYFDYTQDMALLRERIYPYLKESAQVLLHILGEDRGGLLRLPVSTSPEYHSNLQKAWFPPNTNYDTALIREHFTSLERFAVLLDNGEREQWSAVLKQLPELEQDGKGALKIARNQKYARSHRHQSHAMAIYPLRQIRYTSQENRRTIDATLRRMERKGSGEWCGYTYPWASCLYSMAGRGESARDMLNEYVTRYISPNGFHLNGDYNHVKKKALHYRPFTLEGNFAFNDALQQMLVQDGDGTAELFPSIPKRWRQDGVSFENLRVRGGYLLSASIRNNRLTQLHITAPSAGPFCLTFGGRQYTFDLKQGTQTLSVTE